MTTGIRWATIALTAAFLTWGSHSAEATILIFDQGVPQAYGDRVSMSPQAGFTYGNAGEGFTPNVVVDYGPNLAPWPSAYGDLTNVVFAGNGILEIVLTADPGFVVRLHDFDMAGWPDTDYTINSVQVVNAANAAPFSQSNVLIQGDFVGPRHTDFDFSPLLESSILRIRFDSSNLGGNADNIGIDNIRFSQAAVDGQVPEPGTLMLLGGGLAGLAVWRRRRR